MLEVDIQKRFGTFSLDVQFTADTGTTALLGASGCGKSLTLKCIAGIEKPDSGRIVLNGRTLFDQVRKINLPPRQRKVGYLFQNYALFPHMTVRQNITAALHHLAARERPAIVEQKITAFALDGLANKYPSQLSGGQQQRAALARLSAADPELIMLDEPFSALDNFLRWQMEQQIMKLLQNYGHGALFVSHDRDEVYRLCDQVALLDDGKIDMICPKREMFESPRSVAAAKLTGCKNISLAHAGGSRQLHATDWDCTLQSSQPLPPQLGHVGVRAHFIEAADGQDHNRLRCRIHQKIEDSFSMILLLENAAGPPQETASPYLIRWELSKEAWQTLDDGTNLVDIYLPPDKLLLLQ